MEVTLKGKDTFTAQEIETLIYLILERVNANRSGQKSIRSKMRRIGFYGRDDFGINNLQPDDLEYLIRSGKITVVDDNINPQEGYYTKNSQYISNESNNEKSEMLEDLFRFFDPSKNVASDIPSAPGNYFICLRENSKLPDIGINFSMEKFDDLNLIYTGISGNSLRTRDYRQHFTGNNAGRSTLRKSIGSMFGLEKIPRDSDPNTGKTKFTTEGEEFLTDWMIKNLVLYYLQIKNPKDYEDDLITRFNPPLNLAKNKNKTNFNFRRKLSRLRNS